MFSTLGEFRSQLHLRLLEIDDLATAHPTARLNAACNQALKVLSNQFMAVPFLRTVAITQGTSSVAAAHSDGGFVFYLVELAWVRFALPNSNVVYDLQLAGGDFLPQINAANPTRGIPQYAVWSRSMGAGPAPSASIIVWPTPAMDGTLHIYGAYEHPTLTLDADQVFLVTDFREPALDLALAYVYEATDTQPRNHLIELAFEKARRAQYHVMRRESWYRSERKVLKGRSI